MGISVNQSGPTDVGPQERYDVEINGVLTTLSLTAEQAAARGLTRPDPVQDAAPVPPAANALEPANKAVTSPATKRRSNNAGPDSAPVQ